MYKIVSSAIISFLCIELTWDAGPPINIKLTFATQAMIGQSVTDRWSFLLDVKALDSYYCEIWNEQA